MNNAVCGHYDAQPAADTRRPENLESMNVQNDELKLLIQELEAIRRSALELAAAALPRAAALHPTYTQSARNLLHYLALRRQELRPLQKRLSALGLSSLGRTEAHVLASMDRVLETLHHLAGIPFVPRAAVPPVNGFEEGRDLLDQHTEALLGPPPGNRVTRIMVTMPTAAADDPSLIAQLLANGMDCMRINCAHDDAKKWRRMIQHLRKAEKALGRKCRIMMDLAGPKLRTGPIEPGEQVVRWKPRRNRLGQVTAPARIWLFPEDVTTVPPASAAACVPVSGPWLKRLRTGDHIRFVDARGSRRTLRVAASEGCGRWAEADRTAYVIPGTILRVPKRAGKARTKPAFHEVRIGTLPALEQVLELKEGDSLILTKGDVPGRPAQRGPNGAVLRPAQIGCTLPAIFADVRAGQSIWFDDGRIGGTIESVEQERIQVRIVQARFHGEKLRADKGINLPESVLHAPGLTEKDIADLPFVAAHADMVGYSFVRTPADVEALEARLKELGGKQLGIVLKIETREAFEKLPALLLASMRSPCDGVMIARGDLAIECGFERLAEVQEQILWICEAAHVPVIWATQVLESVAKEGLATRAEVSDAASSQRAECVMLNKGPHIARAVLTLENILRRMEGHQQKKRAMLRPLELARRFRH